MIREVKVINVRRGQNITASAKLTEEPAWWSTKEMTGPFFIRVYLRGEFGPVLVFEDWHITERHSLNQFEIWEDCLRADMKPGEEVFVFPSESKASNYTVVVETEGPDLFGRMDWQVRAAWDFWSYELACEKASDQEGRWADPTARVTIINNREKKGADNE